MANCKGEPIAIVGTACRFAGSIDSTCKLWKFLEAPTDICQEIPSSRFNANGFFHLDGSYHGRTNVKHGYFVDDDIKAFDAEFFGVKAIEAQAMDPQQRFLMEVAFEALENAGIPIERLKGSDTGVFVGAMSHDYGTMMVRDPSDVPIYTATGIGASILSNRLSYFFDWHGPSITLDTACSSSLVAVHLAIQTLRAGDSKTVLACGSNLILGPENFIIESKLKMLSPDGRCRMWDQKADGYARGEGVGVLVLKTLRDALSDGDSIQCVIRETSLNQDGASTSSGITVPNAAAQEALIRATYHRAGLDLTRPEDGPQFFEAHGTGTPAGDPVEAEAIYHAISKYRDSNSEPLYVGSIKTILGHTEGTAGIAAVMKASLALKHRIVPPNLLFNRVSSRVAPFYQAIEVPTTAKPWPQLKSSTEVRRASVNSFGFGGQNAHAILESYDESETLHRDDNSGGDTFAPYVFSASSERSLRQSLTQYARGLQDNHRKVCTHDLAWTLSNRRSVLTHRVTFPASSISDLCSNIASKLAETMISVRGLSMGKSGKVLGIFTGQGAQYPRMGAELIERSVTARNILEKLEASLSLLPDPPQWSLVKELLAARSCSRVYEAAIAQPLCTAIQILIVDILRIAGIEFHTVVGHSSGEIGAAYAAGYLTAEDAVRISYYRGFHLKHACSPNGTSLKGSMLAVDSTVEDLEELCQDPVFLGRISIAAINSASSFTLSGDEDAIEEMQILLDDEQKFNRRLKVDMAYHSNHMLSCSRPYLNSLLRCRIQRPKPSTECKWVSSVYGCSIEDAHDLAGKYWIENLTRPVLFSRALEVALQTVSSPYDLVLEVGPHPALQRPSMQVIERTTQRQTSYVGALSRNDLATSSFSIALGIAWATLENGSIDLGRYETEISGRKGRPRLVSNLPTYSWNHESQHWHESRLSRNFRNKSFPGHCLLGSLTSASTAEHKVWQNLLLVRELDWLLGHRVQSQIVFPAAGYLAAALEAARIVANSFGMEVRLFDLDDFVVHRAMVFDHDDSCIELSTNVYEISRDDGMKDVRAKFTFSAAPCRSQDDLALMASGMMKIYLGQPSSSILPRRGPPFSHMVEVETSRFYQALEELGYEFSGRFQSLSQLQRRHFWASCQTTLQRHDEYLIHPAELDAVLQSCILAYSYPYDGQLRALHVPSSIEKFRINPAAIPSMRQSCQSLPFGLEASIKRLDLGDRGLSARATMFQPHAPCHGAIQVRNIIFRPAELLQRQDKKMFLKEYWVSGLVDSFGIAQTVTLTEYHDKLHSLLERIATFYLRKFDSEITSDDPIRLQPHLSHYLNYARFITSKVQAGKHRVARPEWFYDTLEDISEASSAFPGVVDVEIMQLVGSQMPRVFRGETTMLEEFRSGTNAGILDRYYAEAFGLKESATWIAEAVSQIVDRYPRMNILEIGAGTGSATRAIFRKIGERFSRYTYTDISAAFFENASRTFCQHQDKMVFKTLDIEKSPLQQGYDEGAYDLIVAFFVIHATNDLEQTLRHLRKLIRPGGFLIVGEGQDGLNSVASSGFIFGTLPGWWLGAGEEGRSLSPHVSPDRWDHLLRATGFSGTDFSVSKSWQEVLSVHHFVTQAVDEQIRLLREPLMPNHWPLPLIEKLVIVGGGTERTSSLVQELQRLLANDYASESCALKTLTEIDFHKYGDVNTTILSLVELDNPTFENITPETFRALQNIFGSGKRVFWVTSGRLNGNPFSNMTIGFGRVAANESPDLRLQQLDIQNLENANAKTLAEIFLRFYASDFLDESVLWSQEPELRIDGQGQQLMSRLRSVSELNDRYNSTEQNVTHETITDDSPVVMEQSKSGLLFRRLSSWEMSISKSLVKAIDHVILRVSHATTAAIRTPLGHKFVVLGSRSGGGSRYLAFASELASVITVPAELAVPIDVAKGSEQTFLDRSAAHVISTAVIGPLFHGQSVLIRNATPTLTRALEAQAVEMNLQVMSTTDLGIDFDEGGDLIDTALPHDSVTNEDESKLMFNNIVVFVDFAAGEPPRGKWGVPSYLPSHCRIENAKTLFASTGTNMAPNPNPAMAKILWSALRHAERDLGLSSAGSLDISQAGSQAVTLDKVFYRPLDPSPLKIIEFNRETLVDLHATRLDVGRMFKGSESTYWIAGMTGALGISLCDWMIRNGARNIVITSRAPEISSHWIDIHKRRGATITVVTCDITQEDEVKAAYRTIQNSLPPVVGVINGAMVLRDVSISNMAFEELVEVLAPKVSGSIHLDRLFHDIDLDFFVMISSINCVIGSWGQANYAAANMFMCGLAAQRRLRGRRAAAVNVGAIVGAGYMERENRRALDDIVRKLHMTRLSEEDWHQAVCEAIDASRLESGYGPELTTGLSEVAVDVMDRPIWFNNPRYSEFITPMISKTGSDEALDATAPVSLQYLIQNCSSQQDLRAMIGEHFADQIRRTLQLAISNDDLLAAQSGELGIDSLVSVDIRSWFFKNLEVSIPVMMIMGNSTLGSLVDFAVDNMPKEMTPNLCANEGQAHTPTTTSWSISGEDYDHSAILLSLSSKDHPEPERTATKLQQVEALNRIDWEAETAPSEKWTSIKSVWSAENAPTSQSFVLTGSTGLLGHHLLEYLLDRTSVKSIHCLAVRRLEARMRSQELSTDARVKYYPGNLSDPLLGLSVQQAESIFSSASAVIHAAADTSHVKLYSDLKSSNVGSTRALTELCLPRRIPIHYISSAGVGLYFNEDAFPAVSLRSSPAALDPPHDGSFGYGCSKWVCERLLERAHLQFGLPAYIYRPSTIIRDSCDAITARAQLDWVNSLLNYVRKLGKAPYLPRKKGSLDLVRVQSCCVAILDQVCQSNGSESSLVYSNLVGDLVVPLELLSEIDLHKGKRYTLLPMRQWLEEAEGAGLHPGTAMLIEQMDAQEGPRYPTLIKETRVSWKPVKITSI